MKRVRLWLLNWVTRGLLKAVVEQDVITVDTKTNSLFIGSDLLTEEEKKSLRGEAQEFKKTRLYSVLINTPRHYAHENLFNKLTTLDHVWSGKMMLYSLDLQEKIVDRLSTLK